MNAIPRLLACLFAALLAAQSDAAELEAGMSLEQALEQLRDDGIEIVYSSNLIQPDMTVRDLPATGSDAEILAELVVPWGLEVQSGPGGTFLIVRPPESEAPTGRLTGQVLDAFDGSPIEGARVFLGRNRYVTRTDSSGRFLFDGIRPGKYRLRVDYESVSFARQGRAEILPGKTVSVRLEMDGVSTTALDEIVVNASRYQFQRDAGGSVYEFSAADLERSPNVGDDPLRAIDRIPGTARNDFTARTNMRGGKLDENLVRFDGLRLYNPYHLKDFQALFSAIDGRLVDTMDIATGGFPAGAGDRMSGIIDVTSIEPEKDFSGEVTASFFNLSTLMSGRFNEGASHWLISARRGNLDWVLDVVDPSLGRPKYADAYARVGHAFSDVLEVRANVMFYDDEIKIADNDEEEFARGDYRDEYYWLRFDITPNDELAGSVIVAHARLDNKRSGNVEKEGATAGVLDENNDFTINSLQTDWSWWFADDWLLSFGGELRLQDGDYRYSDEAEFELLFLTPGAPTDPLRESSRTQDVNGDYYSFYTDFRTPITEKLTVEAGLRWSRETLSPGNDSALDPRASLLYEFSGATRGRASIGRYSQSQSIDQLDFADGTGSFVAYEPFETVDQVVLGLDHDLENGLTTRLEAYNKDYKDLRPRYENFLDSYTLLPQLWPDRVEIVADRATAQGIEATLMKADDEPLSWWLTYSWSRVRDDVPGRDIRRAWDQGNAAGAGLGWQTQKWEFSIAANWHEGVPITQTELAVPAPLPLVATGRRNANRLGSYFNVDARVARKFALQGDQRLTVFLEVRNLTNRDNDCCVLYEVDDEDGPLEYATDREGQIPIFPSVGFIWQF